MTESEARGFIQGKLDCMNKCNVFEREHSYNTDLCDNCEYCYSQGNFGNQKEAFSVAINALEKQIPKKPNKTIESSWGIQKEAHTCPVCDYYLTEVHFIEPQKIESNKKITYCETCGQAIDWSDEE